MVVIHPDKNNPPAIVKALHVNKAVALHGLSYSEWLSAAPITEHILLCIDDEGEWFYAENAAGKAELRKKIAAR